MEEGELEGLIATTLPNVLYLSGLWSIDLHLFPREAQVFAVIHRDRPAEPLLVLPVSAVDQTLSAYEGVRAVVHYGRFHREPPQEGVELTSAECLVAARILERRPVASGVDALVAALREAGVGQARVGIDERGAQPELVEDLRRQLPGLSLVPASRLLQRIRMVKTPEEVARLRQAATITESAIMAALAEVTEGVTELRVATAFNRAIVEQSGRPFFTLIRFGRNAVLGQLPPGSTPLRPGDSIWFDVGCIYEGYHSDLARMAVLGEPSSRLRDWYRAVLNGEEAGMLASKPGTPAAAVFDATVDAVKQGGIPHYRRHHVGHGIGLEVYDPPLLAPGRAERIEEGMVLNIETPYYEFGWGALHVEDPFLVTAEGPQLLTSLNRALAIVGRGGVTWDVQSA